MAGASIHQIIPSTFSQTGVTSFSEKTDQEGRWTCSNITTKSIQLELAKDGYVIQRDLKLSASEGEQKVVLKALPMFSGRVLDAATQEPITHFMIVEISAVLNNGKMLAWSPYTLDRGHDGQYSKTITAKKPPYLLRVDAEGYKTAITPAFEKINGKMTYDFLLEKGVGASLEVLLPDGEPAANAMVCMRGEKDNGMSIRRGQAQGGDDFLARKTDARGKVTLTPRDDDYTVLRYSRERIRCLYEPSNTRKTGIDVDPLGTPGGRRRSGWKAANTI